LSNKSPRRENILRDVLTNRRGDIIILFALMLPILVGMVGLGVEVGSWYFAKRNLQSAADAAAVAALFEVRSGSSDALIEEKAKEEATANGWDETAGDTLVSSSPPLTGAFEGDTQAVEVTVTKPINLLFASLFLGETVTANARAVARLQKSSEACILALNTTASAAINVSGNVDVTLNGCSIAANSNSSEAIDGNGSVELTTDCATTVGGTDLVEPQLTLTTCTAPVTGALPIDDPYEDTPEPDVPADCDEDGFTNTTGDVTVSPGRFCNGFGANGGTVTMNHGLYIIDQGNFNVNGNATLQLTSDSADDGNPGVTIILLDSSGGDDPARVNNINGGAIVNLTARAEGVYAGLLFYQVKSAETTDTNTFNGGPNISLEGAIYIPKEAVQTGGNSALTGGCIHIVASTVSFQGDANFSNNCDSSGTTPITINQGIGLVE
jgi:Flp pilus assembly protein TadG